MTHTSPDRRAAAGARVVVQGDGPPVVLIPGVQGRWEYSRGLVDALSVRHTVITFSLCDERTATPDGGPLDVFADQAVAAMQQMGIERAAVVGVSFGGLVALRVAARHPDRVSALVMVSAPGPRWHLRPRHDAYARVPWLFGPIFLAETPWRLRREVATALPDWGARLRYLRAQAHTVATAPVSLARMAARARIIGRYDRASDCARVSAPTLIVQGDLHLDHVTGHGGTHEYANLISRATLATLADTGHIGSVTRPAACAELIDHFLSTRTQDARHSAA